MFVRPPIPRSNVVRLADYAPETPAERRARLRRRDRIAALKVFVWVFALAAVGVALVVFSERRTP